MPALVIRSAEEVARMVTQPKPTVIDAEADGELARVARAASERGERFIVRADGEALAVVQPLPHKRARGRRRLTTEEKRAALIAAAGSWRDVDTDALIARIYADRDRPPKPPVEL
jgi:hypothetical protein